MNTIRQPETLDWYEDEEQGIGFKWTCADKGLVLPQHSHPYSHTLFLASGAIWFWAQKGQGKRYDAPAFINVPAHLKHFVETLAPNTTLLCIHNTRMHGGHEIEAENSIEELE